ncbi:MAG: response regulator receiver modulated diguanylate cyclase [Parcubacteria group bacterium Licking1014_1]|nr:MAG: response regulator receiver modulated diguanylate cyclase [Parcubacteria group bacterium Licking1014_1]
MKKILIVEDDAVMLSTLTDNFIKEGFEIIKAGDGKEGLETALREHPDLILLDILMPVMDGMTMLKKLREDAWGKDAKVIMLTNLSDNKDVAEAIEQGSYDYLVKSDWKIEDAVAKIRDRLEE